MSLLKEAVKINESMPKYVYDIFLDIEYSKYNNIKYILDCWNKLDKKEIENAGINYIGVGI